MTVLLSVIPELGAARRRVRPGISPGRAWVQALRLRTLSAGAAPVLVGLGLAANQGVFEPVVAAVTLLGALFIQTVTNLANDYYDHLKGVDKEDRMGPARVTGKLIPLRAVRNAMIASIAASVLAGLYLVWAGGWPILAIGLASLVCAVAYAGGPWPLGHHGLGDLAVFVFFGPVAVLGTYYLQAGTWPMEALVAGAGLGGIITNILVVNNVRDIPTDRRAGKRTMAVRLGVKGSWIEYALLLGLTYAAPVVLWAAYGTGAWTLLPLVTLPVGGKILREGWTHPGGAGLNKLLAKTAALTALYGALFALGLALG